MLPQHCLLIQIPHGTPMPGEGKTLDFSDPFEVIVYVILPILLIVFYLIWRKKKRKNK
ncbi:adenylosuccinate synthetase [Winogradskyella ursingii]|uniref:adenylosuccinate synthetase n=1 Tax=Winogradskyella ursingii TaxID=2686079 RepID=UPI0015C949AD|nr:adenylosuccinate synthetase [Winogradskyella ursingii]